jgi:rRNA-processing protein FCF1
LDTNFLLIPAQFRIDIYQEIDRIITRKYDLIIIPQIIEELKELAKESKKHESEVRIAFELAKKCQILEPSPTIQGIEEVDEIILQSAINHRWIVATNDAALRKKLRSHQLPTITLRNKAYLVLEGDLP